MMEPQHRSEENVGRAGRGLRGGVGVLSKRKVVRKEVRLHAVTLCFFLLAMWLGTAQANRPPRFVLDGNVGSEIVVRMREEVGERSRRVIR